MILNAQRKPGGLFFVFEGIDGCGKSKQVVLTKRWLEKKHKKPIKVTKEPNKQGKWGKIIYQELKKKGGLHKSNPYGFQTWYAFDSRANYRDVIIPALRRGMTVLSDRGRPSMVYGVSKNIGIESLMRMNQAILREYFVWPDAVFIFDVCIDTAIRQLERKNRSLDAHEKSETLSRVRLNYHEFANLYPNCHIIDGEKDPETINQNVQKIIIQVMDLSQ